MGVIAATLHAVTIFQVLFMWTEKHPPNPIKTNKVTSLRFDFSYDLSSRYALNCIK